MKAKTSEMTRSNKREVSKCVYFSDENDTQKKKRNQKLSKA